MNEWKVCEKPRWISEGALYGYARLAGDLNGLIEIWWEFWLDKLGYFKREFWLELIGNKLEKTRFKRGQNGNEDLNKLIWDLIQCDRQKIVKN